MSGSTEKQKRSISLHEMIKSHMFEKRQKKAYPFITLQKLCFRNKNAVCKFKKRYFHQSHLSSVGQKQHGFSRVNLYQ